MSRRSRRSRQLAKLRAETSPTPLAGSLVREYLIFAGLSAGLCLAGVFLHRLVFTWGMPSVWILFEVLFELVFALGLYSWCGSLRVVLLTQFTVGNLFRILNSIKLKFLDVAVLPSDLILIGDLRLLLGGVKFGLIAGAILLPLVALGVLAWKYRRTPVGRRAWGFVPAALGLGWIVFFPKTYYSFFDWMLHGHQIGLPFQLTLREEKMGVAVTFSTQLAKYLELHRSVPSRSEVASVLREVSPQVGSGPAPSFTPPSRNVYVILTETFWDPSNLWSGRGIDAYLDPEFQKLWARNGHRWMMPPVFGGNTANTEFELLCGIPAKVLTDGIVFQSALSNRLACLPEMLKRLGYRTLAFHPFSPGFFNRTGAFPLIGFEHFFSLEDFSEFVVPGFPIVPDADFIRESIRHARTEAAGRPFLAYMMTFAGHWPFNWVPDLYPWTIHIPGADSNPDLATLERHLNINRLASTVLAKAVESIFETDPTGLIVISGDHLPGLAKESAGEIQESVEREALYFQTPLLILDGQSGPPLGQDLSAFGVPGEILKDMGVPRLNRGFLPWFDPPPDRLIRPTPSGELLVIAPHSAPLSCGSRSGSEAAPCVQAEKWFGQTQVLGRDLVFGSQFSTKKE